MRESLGKALKRLIHKTCGGAASFGDPTTVSLPEVLGFWGFDFLPGFKKVSAARARRKLQRIPTLPTLNP